jgi:hypothetical protein
MQPDERFLHQVLGCIAVVAEHTGEAHQRTALLSKHLSDERVGIDRSMSSNRRCLERHVIVDAISSDGLGAGDVIVELSVERKNPADHREGEDVQSVQQTHQQEQPTDAHD